MNTEIKTVRILLVDDHAIVREGLRALLDDVPGMRIVGEASNGDEAVELAARLQPDLVLMDLKMPGLPAPDAIRTIRARNPGVHVLMLDELRRRPAGAEGDQRRRARLRAEGRGESRAAESA